MRIWHPFRAGFDRHDRTHPSVHAPAPGNTRAPAPHPVPGQRPLPLGAHGLPPRPAPAPALTPDEHRMLNGYHRTRPLIPPGHTLAAREIADGLRQRFPQLDDTTLGAVTLDLHGYALAITLAMPGHAHAPYTILDCLGLAAEELTRLERTETLDARD